MKKILLLFIMFGLCISCYFMTGNRNTKLSQQIHKENLQSRLQEHSEKIDNSYPDTPKEVIELNNKLMGYLYSKDMQKEAIDLYTETVRRLYDETLLALNSKEDQIRFILIEMEQDAKSPIRLLESKIEEVTLIDDRAEVKVTHYLNRSNLVRIYTLTRDSGQWKIVSWENLLQESTKAEE